MRKVFRFCFLLLALTALCSIGFSSFAAGSVSYAGGAEKFIFAPGSEYSPTDLFDSFKGVMPGDSITQQVVIKNDVANEVKVKIYMRSLGAQEGTDEFLSRLTLTVDQVDGSNLFAAPANETAQLTDWVYLGTVFSGGEITLDVTLDVPVEIGNEFADSIGYVDWQFKVEEFPVEPDDPEPPYTGNNSKIFLYAGLMTVSLGALVLLLIMVRRRKQNDND